MQRDKAQVESTSFTAPEKVAVNEVLAIIHEVLKCLPTHLRDKFGEELTDKLGENENFYNEELQGLLQDKSFEIVKKDNNRNTYNFRYQHVPYKEYLSNNKGIQPTVEMGVFTSSSEKNAFFTIECKRLRTKDNCKHSRQYVSGETGGIKRFKENQHGEYTQQSAMVGYMEDESFDFWLEKVNGWIGKEIKKDGFWHEVDKLIAKKIEDIIAEYVSEHKRKDGKDNIRLTHFWIKMN